MALYSSHRDHLNESCPNVPFATDFPTTDAFNPSWVLSFSHPCASTHHPWQTDETNLFHFSKEIFLGELNRSTEALMLVTVDVKLFASFLGFFTRNTEGRRRARFQSF